MPLARYFFYVGGALLALVFVADFCLPQLPVSGSSNIALPAIRIHSDQKWPDRVVYDTSRPTIAPAQPPKTEINVPTPATVADASAKARDAFAQLQPSATNHPQPSDPGERQPKPSASAWQRGMHRRPRAWHGGSRNLAGSVRALCSGDQSAQDCWLSRRVSTNDSSRKRTHPMAAVLREA